MPETGKSERELAAGLRFAGECNQKAESQLTDGDEFARFDLLRAVDVNLGRVLEESQRRGRRDGHDYGGYGDESEMQGTNERARERERDGGWGWIGGPRGEGESSGREKVKVKEETLLTGQGQNTGRGFSFSLGQNHPSVSSYVPKHTHTHIQCNYEIEIII